MTRAPLDALLRRVSRMAEQMFDKQGEIDPIWLVERASGEQHTIISPIFAPPGLATADYNDKLEAKMRETFADLDVVRYARNGMLDRRCGDDRRAIRAAYRGPQAPSRGMAAAQSGAIGFRR